MNPKIETLISWQFFRFILQKLYNFAFVINSVCAALFTLSLKPSNWHNFPEVDSFNLLKFRYISLFYWHICNNTRYIRVSSRYTPFLPEVFLLHAVKYWNFLIWSCFVRGFFLSTASRGYIIPEVFCPSALIYTLGADSLNRIFKIVFLASWHKYLPSFNLLNLFWRHSYKDTQKKALQKYSKILFRQ